MPTITTSDTAKMIQICGELFKSGFVYTVRENGDDWIITITGY